MTKQEIKQLAKEIDEARIEWSKGYNEYANMKLQTIIIKLKESSKTKSKKKLIPLQNDNQDWSDLAKFQMSRT